MKFLSIVLCLGLAQSAFAAGVPGGKGKGEYKKPTGGGERPAGEIGLTTATAKLTEAIGKINSDLPGSERLPEINVPRGLDPAAEKAIAERVNALRTAMEKNGSNNLKDPAVRAQVANLIAEANSAMASRESYQSAAARGVEGAAEIVAIIDNILSHLASKIEFPDRVNEADMIAIYQAVSRVSSAEASPAEIARVQAILNSLGKAIRDVVNCR